MTAARPAKLQFLVALGDMFENTLDRAFSSLSALGGAESFRGLIGAVLFLLVALALTQVPASLRQRPAFWLVEALVLPAVLLLGAALITLFLPIDHGKSGTDYISAVALLLGAALLLDHAVRLFVWRGVLRHHAHAVPAVAKTIVSTLFYLGSTYLILAVVYDQPVTGLVVSSGVLLAVIGLALQPVLGDLIAGISLSIDRPFKVGDLVEIDGETMGTVITTDWRATRLLTRQNTVHVIPNGRLSNAAVLNYDQPEKTYGFGFHVTVARSVPPPLVTELLLDAAIRAPSVLADPEPVVRVWDVEEQPIRYYVFVYCADYSQHFAARSETLSNAWSIFKKAGFTFATRSFEGEIWRGQPAEGHELAAENLLEEIPLLAPLTLKERGNLAEAGEIRRFAANEPIVLQGENGDSAFIVLSGMVRIHVRADDESAGDIELALLGPLNFFGEMSLLTGAERSASVTAKTKCKLIEIPKPSLAPILEQRPEIADELAKLMAERKFENELAASARISSTSVGDMIAAYTQSFARGIRSFFQLGEAKEAPR